MARSEDEIAYVPSAWRLPKCLTNVSIAWIPEKYTPLKEGVSESFRHYHIPILTIITILTCSQRSKGAKGPDVRILQPHDCDERE